MIIVDLCVSSCLAPGWPLAECAHAIPMAFFQLAFGRAFPGRVARAGGPDEMSISHGRFDEPIGDEGFGRQGPLRVEGGWKLGWLYKGT